MILTFYVEPDLALVGLHVERAHGLVPDGALVGGLVVVHGGHQKQRAVGGSVGAALLDFEPGGAGANRLLVAEPGDVGLRVAALREAAQLVLQSFASWRRRAAHYDGWLRRD